MGIMDKIKGLLKGREHQAKGGIDTASDQAQKRVGSKYASKVDDVSDKAKDAVDRMGAENQPGSPTSHIAGTPPEATPLTTDPTDRPPTTPPA